MKIKKDRNYLIAFCGCIAVTTLSAMGERGFDNWQWFIKADINVAIWLFVAWLFDDK